MTTTSAPALKQVSQLFPDENGHLEELRVDPIGLMRRVREECGDIGTFRLVDRDVVLVTGAEANEVFFRAPDDVLDQGEAYPFMTPIFGKGVVFDASPERRKEMLRNQALRGEQMKGHAETISREIERMVAGWGDEGENELTLTQWDVVSVPTGIMRGFRNDSAGDSDDEQEEQDIRLVHRPLDRHALALGGDGESPERRFL